MRAIDPIDRIALMEKLGIGKECTVCEQNSDPYCMWKPDVVDVCEAICTAPTVMPERNKGHWIKGKMWSEGIGMGETYGFYYSCSECNNSVQGGYDECGKNFCEKCGADNRGDGETDE